MRNSQWFKTLVATALIAGVSLPAFAKSLVVAREAAVAIMDTRAGQTLARELGVELAAQMSAAQRTDAFLKALDKNPALKKSLAAQSQQFIQMAESGQNLSAISNQLGIPSIKATRSMTKGLKVQNQGGSAIRQAVQNRTRKDAGVDKSLARKAMQKVAQARRKLQGKRFLRDGFVQCMKTFNPRAVNSANDLAHSGANGILAASSSGTSNPMQLLTAGAQRMFHRYSQIFGVNRAEAKRSVCKLGGGQCRMWATGTACL